MTLEADSQMSAGARERVNGILERGCSCGNITARLTRRKINSGSICVYLQCTNCGHSIGGSLPRKEFCSYQDYPEWDQSLHDRYDEERWREINIREELRKASEEARKSEFEYRKLAYYEWLQTSPKWHELRARVLERANWICEACLQTEATQVHHLTYEYGVLPPAWHLRAVCKQCHQNIHDEWPIHDIFVAEEENDHDPTVRSAES